MLMRKSEHSLIEALKPWIQTLTKGSEHLLLPQHLLACKTVSCGPRVTPAEERPPSPPKAKAGRPWSKALAALAFLLLAFLCSVASAQTMPTVTSIRIPNPPGATEIFATDDLIKVLVAFDEAVAVDTTNGNPTIDVEIGDSTKSFGFAPSIVSA